jgi:hypothetical protein
MTPEFVYGQLRLVALALLTMMGIFLLETTSRQREIRGATARVGWAEERIGRLEHRPKPAEPAAPRARPAKKTAAKADG